MEWWSIFQRVTSPEDIDKNTGQIRSWRIDFVQALAAFDLFGIEDKKAGIEMLDWIEHCMRRDLDLPDEFILYGEPIADSGEA